MKKIFTLFVLGVLVLAVHAQKKIAYVVASGTTAETLNTTDPFWNSLKANTNYAVTAVELAAGVATNDAVAGADVVILTENPGSSAAGITELNGFDKPMLMMKMFALSCQSGRWGWAIDDQAANRASEPANEVTVTVPSGKQSHAIYKDVTVSSGVVSVLKEAVASSSKGMQTFPISGIKISGGALDVLGASPSDANRFSIAEVPVGATVGGFNATYGEKKINKKLVIIGIHYPASTLNLTNITADGLKLLNNAVAYLMPSGSNVDQIKNKEIRFAQTGSKIFVSFNEAQKAEVAVFNIAGKQLLKDRIVGTSANINLTGYQGGVYIVKVDGEKASATHKIVIR